MEIFVGNLSFEAGEDNVRTLFETFGTVLSVAIVMRKEKKAPKSRGFCFVNMPDDTQALAAIAGLHGQEFMGRVLDVTQARPKAAEGEATKAPKEEKPRVSPLAKEMPQERAPSRIPFSRPGSSRIGRRTRSYLKKQEISEQQVEMRPVRKYHVNPMPWGKKKDQLKPWQKKSGAYKPWKKAGGEERADSRPDSRPPWKRAEGARSETPRPPWKRTGEERADARPASRPPWKKPEGTAWKRSEGAAWKKPEGTAWKRSEGTAWKKPEGATWKKSEGAPWKKKARTPGARPFGKPRGFKR